MTKIIYKSQSSSTNEEITSVINDENYEVALYTYNQTNGKGQYGNSWTSSANQNLAYSLAIPIKMINLSDVFFNYHTALIVREFIDNLTQEKIQIKWPNDIILNQKKICGILIEKNEMRQNGIIKNADEDGFIWIELEEDGLQKFYHKEIELLY